MDLRKLRHAVVLSHWQNFTKAAEALHLTQSALSRSIQSREQELGLLLFDRSRTMVSLTQAGREIIRVADVMLRNEAEMKGIARQSASGEGARVMLGVTPLTARLLLPDVLSERVDQPHFHAEIILSNRPRLIPMVMQERIDLCLCASEKMLAYAGLTAVPLAQVVMTLIVRRDHPLTRMPTLRSEDVARFPIVRGTHYSIEEAEPFAFGPLQSAAPALTIEDHDVLSRVTAASNAVWATSPLLASSGIREGKLVELPLSWLPEPPRIALTAYHLARRPLSPSVASILEHLGRIGAEISAR
jgi:DNA-binding transcriptional LysR family regulator